MITSIVVEATRTTWAIREDALRMLLSVEPDERTAAARRKLPRIEGQVAVLPVYGVISQRHSFWSALFGGTSTEGLGAAYQQALGDDRIQAIVLDVDSPGGTISGVEEVADLIDAGSQQKVTAAIANSEAASAAYWIASQVGGGQKRLAAAPGSDVGSIGVYRVHEDVSEMLAQDGVKVTFLAVPEFKTEANPYEPLSAEAREHHLSQVEATYERFVAAVARGRGVEASAVRERYGRGRMFEARQAADMGLVDRVATMGQLFRELGVGRQAQLSDADGRDVLDSLCHAWETGQISSVPNRKNWRVERVERKYRLT